MEQIMILNKLSSPFLAQVSLHFRLFMFLAFMGTLLAATLVGVASGDSHVITDEYIDVEPDGYWTGQVEPGEHQVWSFDIKKPRDHNIRITIIEGSSLEISLDGDGLGNVTSQADFTVWLKPGNTHELRVDNTGGTRAPEALCLLGAVGVRAAEVD